MKKAGNRKANTNSAYGCVSKEWKRLFLGSFFSSVLFVLHWLLLLAAVLLFLTGNWKVGILTLGVALLAVWASYRLAGGRRNTSIWEGKDLFEVLRYAADTRQARIGFHTLKDQATLLAKLEAVGIGKQPSQDTRQFIRDIVSEKRQAFNICRPDIVIEMIHNGRTCFWDGYGKRTTAEHFYKAEIIIDLKSFVGYAFGEVLEGFTSKDQKEQPCS